MPIDKAAGKIITIEIKVTTPGKIGLKLSDTMLRRVTRGDQKDNLRAEQIVADLPVGVHQFHFGMPSKRPPFSIEIIDLPGSKGVAEPVNK